MSRSSNLRCVKPSLEQLEERAQPSILLGGGIQQLAAPLDNMVKDMQSASTDLQLQFHNLQTNNLPPTSPANSFNGAEQLFGKMVGDWQRILNDNAAIHATVTADLAFLRSAAFAEFATGNDPTDLIILTFGPLIGFNPTKALTNDADQADSILKDPALTNIINLNPHTQISGFLDSTVSIGGLIGTNPPSF